jgi:hypothetical protein
MVDWYLDTRELPLRHRGRGLHLARGKEDQASGKGRKVPKGCPGQGGEATSSNESRITFTHRFTHIATRQYSNHSGRYEHEKKRKTRCRQYGGRVYACTPTRRYPMTIYDDLTLCLSLLYHYVLSVKGVDYYTGLLSIAFRTRPDGVTTLKITREQR